MSSLPKKIVTRFPPSPTGNLHVGSARTALFNYLFARKHGGTFLLRFEDTDTERSKKEFEENIFRGLEWLSLEVDEVHRQSERALIYEKYLSQLISENKAYEAEEAEGGEGKVIRLRNPGKTVLFEDQVRGNIAVNTIELGDFIIARNIHEPLYHLAVVIDDFEMEITDVIRGEDGIYNTPRQILIQEAIGAPRPRYCHIPFILGEDRSKLSKRNGAISLLEYQHRGILPEALLNYLAFLGWNPGGEKEIFSKNELISIFDLARLQKAPAIFNQEKLSWFNREYIKMLSDEALLRHCEAWGGGGGGEAMPMRRGTLQRLLPELRERIATLKDITEIFESGEYEYCFSAPTIDPEFLPEKNLRTEEGRRLTKNYLAGVMERIALLPEYPTPEEAKKALWEYATKQGRGAVLWPLRFALSGRDHSPDPFSLIAILGRMESQNRVRMALSLL